jgi:hypothetical protein
MCLSELGCCLVCIPNYLTFCCVYYWCVRGVSDNTTNREEPEDEESNIELII